MKKMLALILCSVMLLGVFTGCNASKPGKAAHTLQAGYGRADITPKDSVPIAGRKAGIYTEKVVDPLYATCTALTDETGNTVLIFHLDLISSVGLANMTRKRISNETGVEPLQIYMCSTHNHSGPNLDSSNESITIYNKTFPDKLVQAAKDAMADRKTVTGMYITAAYPENLNFCRHHILDDGTKTGWATPATSRGVSHLLKADNELQLVKLTRDGGKDIVMMNWQGHPDAASAEPYAIASDVDVIRREIEPLLNCHFTYFLGASGNVNSKSYVKSERQASWYIKNYVDRGKKLVEYAVAAAENFRKVETGALQIDSTKQTIRFRNGNGEIDVPITAVSFGKVAFCIAPYEMFTECGQKIKQDSPFEMTIVSTCSTGHMSYIPSEYVYEYSSYEGDNSKYAPGAAEIMVEAHVKQLQKIYDAAK